MNQNARLLDTCLAWSMTLIEPLLPPTVRARAEAGLANLALGQPRATALYIGGATADLILTLPDHDPWRALSYRIGGLTGGTEPPAVEGAARAGGLTFGTYLDSLDLVEPLYNDPAMDPAIAALADGLSPAAAAVLGAAGHSHEAASRALMQVHDGTQLGDAIPFGRPDRSRLDRARAAALLHAGTAALRWAAHRRRQYMGFGDAWIGEACFRWAYRAELLAKGQSLPSIRETMQAVSGERIVRAPAPAPNWD